MAANDLVARNWVELSLTQRDASNESGTLLLRFISTSPFSTLVVAHLVGLAQSVAVALNAATTGHVSDARVSVVLYNSDPTFPNAGTYASIDDKCLVTWAVVGRPTKNTTWHTPLITTFGADEETLILSGAGAPTDLLAAIGGVTTGGETFNGVDVTGSPLVSPALYGKREWKRRKGGKPA